jgi:hypothetical protein
MITVSGLKCNASLNIKGIDSQTVCSDNIDPAGKQVVTKQLDVTGYPSGLYLLQLNCDGKITTARFIVQ